jgi:hypothetical protein
MNDTKISRNDLCHCGSGKNYKKCCLVSDEAGEQPEPLPWQPSRKPPAIAKPSEATISRLLSDNPILPICTKGFTRPVDAENPPPVDSVKLLPVEVSLHYTYREAYGVAEVTYCFPGGHVFLLEHGVPILNDDLKPGMKVQLKGGRPALVTKVILHYEPPDPPKEVKDGLKATRVMGTVKHRGFIVMDVSWSGYTATSTPDHRYFSVTRQTYVPAEVLRTGESLRTPEGTTVPVISVSPPRHGLVDLYNIEVEHYHNFFVGPDGAGVLVHNGFNCIDTPVDLTEADEELLAENPNLSARTPRQLDLVAPDDHHLFPQAEKPWFQQRGFDIDQYTVTPEGWEHEMLHDTFDWNNEIMSRLKQAESELPNGQLLSPSQIEEIGMEMRSEFGLDHLPVHPYGR